ncbi:MAG TPA: hypothetical protein VN931_12805 [Fibrobacteria bacterium]|nr:hypothetical protein [Fibrobacteria bacterium]
MSVPTLWFLLWASLLGSARGEGTSWADTSHAPGSANSPLCGRLPVDDLHWWPDQGPLHISGSVVVGPGQVLSLAAGTVVLASAEPTCSDSSGIQGGTTLSISGGSFFVRGKPGHPVLFQPVAGDRGLSWGGIRVEQAEDGTVDLQWLDLRRARTAAAFVAGSGEMRHAVMEDCGIGIAALDGAAPRIYHSIVSRSTVADVVSELSAPLLRSCLFLDGSGDGIRFRGTGLARVETSCFWRHGGETVVRGPQGLGGWTSDTAPDGFGNWNRDPVLRGSDLDREFSEKRHREVEAAPWWQHARMPELPRGTGPWALSPFSPLLGVGEWSLHGFPNGAHCDIGLWSGP